MKKFIAMATTFAMLISVAACTASGKDFWGNEETPVEETCAAPVHAPEDASDWSTPPGSLSRTGRPIETPEGWGWMVFYFEVLGLAHNGQFMDNRYCLPVDIHIYGTTSEPDLMMISSAGVPVTTQVFNSTTPWFGQFSIQYNPADPRFAGRPPQYEVHLDVAYAAERAATTNQTLPFPDDAQPGGIGCAITTDLLPVWGGENVMPVAQDLGVFPKKQVATCVFSGNRYNYTP